MPVPTSWPWSHRIPGVGKDLSTAPTVVTGGQKARMGQGLSEGHRVGTLL